MIPHGTHLQIGSLLFEGIDQIDLTGPFEVLSRLPDSTYRIYAKTADPVRDIRGLRLTPDAVLGIVNSGKAAHGIRPRPRLYGHVISRGIEDAILLAARELCIGITAYGVLSRGLISGHWRKQTAPGGFRAHSPRFQGANAEGNLALVEALRQAASAIGITVAQAAIAWVAAPQTWP